MALQELGLLLATENQNTGYNLGTYQKCIDPYMSSIQCHQSRRDRNDWGRPGSSSSWGYPLTPKNTPTRSLQQHRCWLTNPGSQGASLDSSFARKQQQNMYRRCRHTPSHHMLDFQSDLLQRRRHRCCRKPPARFAGGQYQHNLST